MPSAPSSGGFRIQSETRHPTPDPTLVNFGNVTTINGGASTGDVVNFGNLNRIRFYQDGGPTRASLGQADDVVNFGNLNVINLYNWPGF